LSARFPYPDPDDVVFKRDLEITQAGKRFRIARRDQRIALEHLEGLQRLHSVIPWTPAAREAEAKWRREYHDASVRASRALDLLIARDGWPLHGTYDADFTWAPS
jgi:hypothetical protein